MLRFLFVLVTVLAMTSPLTAADPVPVFDLHSDILLRATDNGVDIGKPPAWSQVGIPTMREGHVSNQVFAVWVDSRERKGLDATRRALQMFDVFETQYAMYQSEIGLARSVAEADAINAEGRIAVWLWIEGGAPIAEDLALLRTFHRMGASGMTLTWSDNLTWAGSSTDKDNPDLGLNDFGREVVREMNRLRMIVDVSHVSDRTFADVLETSTAPVMASHSGCRALCDHPRNLTDDQMRALAARGGIVGIPLLPTYLGNGWEKGWAAAEERAKEKIEAAKAKYDGDTGNPLYREERRLAIMAEFTGEGLVTLETVLDHIEHALKVAGRDHVAIGSDFDGMWAFPVGLEKPSKWQSVPEGLRRRGHDEATIQAVMNGNARRFFLEVLGK